MYPEKCVLLEWDAPAWNGPVSRGSRIIFPCSTLARKGAYELREAARELDLEIGLLGPVLESPDFWNGVRTVNLTQDNWLDGALAVVEPAYIEHRPIRLL